MTLVTPSRSSSVLKGQSWSEGVYCLWWLVRWLVRAHELERLRRMANTRNLISKLRPAWNRPGAVPTDARPDAFRVDLFLPLPTGVHGVLPGQAA
jgi:hypothetical protein